MKSDNLGIKTQYIFKRVIDMGCAAIGMVLLAPFMAIIIAAIKLSSPGEAIYRQQRIGKNGRPFYLHKFRTMASSNDDTNYMQYLQTLIESDRTQNGDPLPYRKMKSDARVTRVGRLLRRYYLDELPQLWNVFKGDMSLVGPRPHVQFEVEYYTAEQRRRLSVKPGITGYWQVSGKADCSFSELIDMDLEYIDNWSLNSDINFIISTILAMLRGGESFLGDISKQFPASKSQTPPSSQTADSHVYPDASD